MDVDVFPGGLVEQGFQGRRPLHPGDLEAEVAAVVEAVGRGGEGVVVGGGLALGRQYCGGTLGHFHSLKFTYGE